MQCYNNCLGYIAANISAIMSQVTRIEEAQRRHQSGWARGYLRDRAEYGAYNRLMRDLKVHDNVKFKIYLRMELDVFEDLLQLAVILLFIQLLFIYDLSTPMTSVKSRF